MTTLAASLRPIGLFVVTLLWTASVFAAGTASNVELNANDLDDSPPPSAKARTAKPKAAKAAAPKSTGPVDPNRPILSKLGRRRLIENINALAGNVRVLEDNIAASQKNLSTLQSELNELESLEREHQALRQRYVKYLGDARQEIARNERSTDALAQPLRMMASTGNEVAESDAAAARAEKLDRTRWKLDAQEKMGKVQTLMAGVERNLRDIASRKEPLREQIEHWQAREQQYREFLATTMKKRQDYEKWLAN